MTATTPDTTSIRRRLTGAAQRIATARAKQAEAIENARAVALEAIDAGMSERAVTAALGIDRNVVRAWRGKPRTT